MKSVYAMYPSRYAQQKLHKTQKPQVGRRRNARSLGHPLGPRRPAQPDEEVQARELGEQQQRGRQGGVLACSVSATIPRYAAAAAAAAAHAAAPTIRYSVYTIMPVQSCFSLLRARFYST